jgi:RNA polymerase sigma-70 factor (ECF subfamily)
MIPTKFTHCAPSQVVESTGTLFADGIFEADEHVKARSGWRLNGVPLSTRQKGQAPADDVALVTAVLQKDRKATAEFVGTYTDAVYSFIRRRLSPRLDLVDDLVQEVFIAAWENLSSFRGGSPLRAWLLGIARHKVEDHYRGRLQSAQPLEPNAPEELATAEFDMDAIADRERAEYRARQILDELPKHYGAALKWRYWEGRSARQMAEATGRSEKAIERILARAREQFRRRWLA